MEDGWLKHPGASTIGSQLLDGNRSHGWQILATQPWAPIQKGKREGTRHTDQTVEEGGEKGWGGYDGSLDAQIEETLTLAKTHINEPKRYNALGWRARGILVHALIEMPLTTEGWLVPLVVNSVKLHLTVYNDVILPVPWNIVISGCSTVPSKGCLLQVHVHR